MANGAGPYTAVVPVHGNACSDGHGGTLLLDEIGDAPLRCWGWYMVRAGGSVHAQNPKGEPAAGEAQAGSRYQGVTPTKHGTFEVRLLLRDRHVFVGTWPTERSAAIVRDRLVLHLGLGLRLSFPKCSRDLGPLSLDEARALRRPAQKSGDRSSRYVGVTWESNGWRVSVEHEGRRVRLGAYADEKEAAIARDRLVLGLRQEVRFLNFPELNLAPLSIKEERAALRSKRRMNQLCRYFGVAHWPGRCRAWGARIYEGGSQVSLGMWRTA